jgi:hypothetical protein
VTAGRFADVEVGPHADSDLETLTTTYATLFAEGTFLDGYEISTIRSAEFEFYGQPAFYVELLVDLSQGPVESATAILVSVEWSDDIVWLMSSTAMRSLRIVWPRHDRPSNGRSVPSSLSHRSHQPPNSDHRERPFSS